MFPLKLPASFVQLKKKREMEISRIKTQIGREKSPQEKTESFNIYWSVMAKVKRLAKLFFEITFKKEKYSRSIGPLFSKPLFYWFLFSAWPSDEKKLLEEDGRQGLDSSELLERERKDSWEGLLVLLALFRAADVAQAEGIQLFRPPSPPPRYGVHKRKH